MTPQVKEILDGIIKRHKLQSYVVQDVSEFVFHWKFVLLLNMRDLPAARLGELCATFQSEDFPFFEHSALVTFNGNGRKFLEEFVAHCMASALLRRLDEIHSGTDRHPVRDGDGRG